LDYAVSRLKQIKDFWHPPRSPTRRTT
jgi:hypothetical protein